MTETAMKDKPQFATTAEVRKFMGDVYDKVFGGLTKEGVLAIVAGGMRYTTDNLPAINYDKNKDLEANYFIALHNVRIRNCATGDLYAACVELEARRAIVAGMVKLARELIENIPEEAQAHLNHILELRAEAKHKLAGAQFADVDEVREFMGDAAFEAVFVGKKDATIMRMVESGMVYINKLPLIKYDKSKGDEYNAAIMSDNMRIRRVLTSANSETCTIDELRRAEHEGLGKFSSTERLIH